MAVADLNFVPAAEADASAVHRAAAVRLVA
jgi:hypothetical protein